MAVMYRRFKKGEITQEEQGCIVALLALHLELARQETTTPIGQYFPRRLVRLAARKAAASLALKAGDQPVAAPCSIRLYMPEAAQLLAETHAQQTTNAAIVGALQKRLSEHIGH